MYRLLPMRSIWTFQSTLPRGERPKQAASCLLQPVFQSTLPRGERRFCLKSALRPYDFNPRSREGSDFYWFTIIQHMYNFNPRSREGSDALHFVLRHMIHISIHAPARGATSLASALLVAVIFQSTLPRGERQLPSPNRARA